MSETGEGDSSHHPSILSTGDMISKDGSQLEEEIETETVEHGDEVTESMGEQETETVGHGEEVTESIDETETVDHGEEVQESSVDTGRDENRLDGGDAAIVSDEEDDLVWNENRCIVCNVTMNVDDPANQTDGNKKLKKFFFEYLGVAEKLQVLANDQTFPFCQECAEDLDKLMSLACKIEFMDLQFEKLRDTMAKKTVKTYLHRTRPEALNESPEAETLYDDVKDEPLESNLPKRMYNLNDLLFKQWKRQYDVIIPGRYKKYPTLMKAIDSKQRVSYYRIDPSGKHHFIAAVEGPEGIMTLPSESPARTQVIIQGVQGLQQGVLRGLKRKPVFKINGDTLKRMKTCDENSLEESYNGEELEGQRLGEVMESSSGTDKMYKCPLCPKTFTSKSVLTYHSRTHSGELPFVCDVCGKGFAVPHYLMIHMRSHTGERPFKCNVCEKTFAQRGGLATHALVHSGEKPYVCNICEKAFRQKYHLTQHQLIHSGVKPFQCEICERRFNVKMNLREHMRRHTGERPYRCSYCNCQGFFRKKMLRDHIVKAHPERPLPPELTQLGPTPKFPKAKTPSGNTTTVERSFTTVNTKGMMSSVNIKTENQVHQEKDDDEQDEKNEDEAEEEEDSFNMATSATLISIDVVGDDKMPQLHNILDDGYNNNNQNPF